MQVSTKRGARRLLALVVGLGAAGLAIGWHLGDRRPAAYPRARR